VTTPVGVYVGRAAYAAPPRPDRVAGGHGYAADASKPAPAPPVCHEEYVPEKTGSPTPNALHFPEAVRGSFGIQPFVSPSE